MAEIGVDTSSYPKPQQTNFLDVASKLQQLEQQKIGIDTSKLALVNKQWDTVNKELSQLAINPNVGPQDVAAGLQNLVNLKLVPPEMSAQFLKTLPTQGGQPMQEFLKQQILRGQSNIDAVNLHYGPPPEIYPTGQGGIPVVRSQNPNIGFKRLDTGEKNQPIQTQIPPTTPQIDNRQTLPDGTPNPQYGQQVLTGPQPEQRVPQRTIPTIPVQRQSNVNLTGPGKTITDVNVQNLPVSPNQTVQNRFPAPSGPAVGLPPMFEEGKKAYASAQLNASAKAQALKPLIQSIPLMQTPGFLSGPLTDQFTKVVASLKSTGLIDIADNADPTAIRQEAVKKLYQYISNSPTAQRSDAAQTLREASTANPNVQILPALLKLAKDQVALDRVEIIMPNAFKGNDLQNFLKHQGAFPQSIDERALILDQETEEKSKKIVDSMAIKLQSKNNRERNEAEKFFKTLRIAKEQGIYQ